MLITVGIAGLILLIGFVLMVLPVKFAAKLVNAKHTGALRCLLALFVASVLHGLGVLVPVAGTIVAFVLGAVGFMIVLETGFLRALLLSALHAVFFFLLVVATVVLLGGSIGVVLSRIGLSGLL